MVLIGFGRVGRNIGRMMDANGIPYLVVELSRHFVEQLRKQGKPVIYGDASLDGILEHCSLASAKMLVITTPDRFQTRRVIERARHLCPHIDIVVRTHHDEELLYLKHQGIESVVMGEHELANAMNREVMLRFENRSNVN